jgi:glucose-1-phosphate adenylyltransferase
LKSLTEGRTKPAVPFGGKFRLIDFTLSNCINSNLRSIYILTQYKSTSLISHVQEGWDISSSGLGYFIYCVPAQQKLGPDWYRGTADAVRQNLDLVTGMSASDVLVLSGDHVYKMNYLQMLSYHRMKEADVTIAAIKIKMEEAAGRLGVIEIDNNMRMVGFEEKPEQPKEKPGDPGYVLAEMGIYIFKVGALIEIMRGREKDFGRDIMPKMVRKRFDIFIYDYEKENVIQDFTIEAKDGKRNKILVERTRDSSYWRDVGTIDSYFEASMDLVSVDPVFNLYGINWPFRTYQRQMPPSKFVIGASTQESIVCDGCIISGASVRRSVLSPNVTVEKNTLLEGCVIFDDVVIEPNVKLRRVIVDKGALIESGTSIGYNYDADIKRGYSVSETGIVVIPKGANVKPV